MSYVIQKQFIPGNDQIWVEKLDPDDPVYAYETILEAEEKVEQLKLEDPARGFKIIKTP